MFCRQNFIRRTKLSKHSLISYRWDLGGFDGILCCVRRTKLCCVWKIQESMLQQAILVWRRTMLSSASACRNDVWRGNSCVQLWQPCRAIKLKAFSARAALEAMTLRVIWDYVKETENLKAMRATTWARGARTMANFEIDWQRWPQGW